MIQSQLLTRQTLALLSIVFVCIFIGGPLWWKTTVVYRSSLPYSEIYELSDTPAPTTIPITVIVINLSDDDYITLKEPVITRTVMKKDHITSIIVKFEVLAIVVCILDTFHWKPSNEMHTDTESKDSRLKYIDMLEEDSNTGAMMVVNSMYHSQLLTADPALLHSMGHYTIFVVPQTFSSDTVYSPLRHAIVAVTPDVSDTILTVGATLAGIDTVYSALRESSKYDQAKTVSDTVRRVKISEGYQITITLINPDPSIMDSNWNIDEVTDAVLLPFLRDEGISKLANFTVSSQVFYYTDVQLKLQYSKEYSSHYVLATDVPTMISNVEAKLNSHVSQWPSLNFVVYLPKPAESPLHIVQSKGGPGFDAFLVPQWGGVVMYNHPSTNYTGRHLVNVNMECVMQTFVLQLRHLLGISSDEIDLCNVDQSHCLPKWVVDHTLMTRTVETLSISTSSLVSLIELLDDVKNMVISDHIQQQVVSSLEQINICFKSIEQGYWDQAHTAAKLAMHHSETAFFDPSILALLYFPDDQKYAIYVPLFLPISVPIIVSVIKLIKSLKSPKMKSE